MSAIGDFKRIELRVSQLKDTLKWYAYLEIFPRNGGESEIRVCGDTFDTEEEMKAYLKREKIEEKLRMLAQLQKATDILENVVASMEKQDEHKSDPDYPKDVSCARFEEVDGKRVFCRKPGVWYLKDREEFGCAECVQKYLDEYPDQAHRFTRVN
jgi:hypothetical protein